MAQYEEIQATRPFPRSLQPIWTSWNFRPEWSQQATLTLPRGLFTSVASSGNSESHETGRQRSWKGAPVNRVLQVDAPAPRTSSKSLGMAPGVLGS